MILRKPYAFLIKHFRLIHFVIASLMIIFNIQYEKLSSFFTQYVKSSSYLKLYIEPSITSVKFYMFLLSLLIVGMLSAIVVLMNKKSKPVKFYIAGIITYSLIFFILLFTNSQIFSLIQNDATLNLITLSRDLLKFTFFIQYIFIFVMLLRGLGFNVKKFDFKNDLKEMNISEEDSEEFEVEVQIDSNDIKTKIKREIRTIKYIIQENKKLFLLIITGLILYLVITLFTNLFIYNKVYREKSSIRINNYKLKVLESYETAYNYKKVDITSKDKYRYYIVKIEIYNPTTEKINLKLSNIKLKVDEYKSYESDTNSYTSFKDIGVGYTGQYIEPNSKDTYLLVFKVDSKYAKNKKTFEILKNIIQKDNEMMYNYSKVKIKPINLDDIKEKEKVSLNEELNIKDNLFGNVTMKIESIEIVNSVEYKYKEMINEKEYTFTSVIQPSYDDYYGKKIIKLKATVTPETVTNEKLINVFIGNFGNIRYVKNGVVHDNPFKITERTTTSDDEYKYIEVYDEVEKADNIYLDIIIRNNKYVYKIK